MVSFYLKDKNRESTSIQCSINPPGIPRICLSIPNSKINPKDWYSGRMRTGKGRQENGRIQDRLDLFKKTILSFFGEYHETYNKYPNKSILTQFLNSDKSVDDYFNKSNRPKIIELFNRIIIRREEGKELTKGKRFSSQSISLYKSTRKALMGFEKYKGNKKLYIDQFKSKQLIEEFEIYLTTELDMMINTISNKMKTLKSFLQLAVSEGIIEYNPFKHHGIVIYTEETDSVVFTKEEMLALEELDFSENPFHDQVRDQYLIYLWSGVRKSDLRNLLAVVNPNTNKYTFRSEKTGELCEIPAFDTTKRLGEKYNYNFLEPIHDTIVLAEIKKICKLIPSMNNNIEKKYTKGGINQREIKNKYQMVCIHTARRTLATLLYEHGLPLVQIMKITGHKKLATLQKYIKSDSDIEMMLKVGNSIGKNFINN
jgi:integrase